MWLTCVFTSMVPTGPVLLAGDETVAERPGPDVFGTGRHRDGVRSTHGDTADRWGSTWVVVSVLVQCPFTVRPWALLVLGALSRSLDWARAHGTRHQTPAPLVRLLLARLVRWLPARQCICVGDTGYGTSETARLCRTPRRHLTWVRTC
jgi:hypothetical protein